MIGYIALIGIIIAISSHLDKWVSDGAKKSITSIIERNNLTNKNDLLKIINESFVVVFDLFYSYKNTIANRNIYRSIIFCYIFFFIMKGIIILFGLSMPPTEYILFTILIISIYTVILYKAVSSILPSIVELRSMTDRTYLFKLLQSKKFIFNLFLYALCLSFFSLTIVIFTDYFGANLKTYLAFTLWTFTVVILSIFIIIIPVRWYKINPIRSFISSAVFILILTIYYSNFNKSGLSGLKIPTNANLILLTYFSYNLFGDLISLQETRWILVFSSKVKAIYFPVLLVFDIFLSGMLFIILPLLSDVSLNEILYSIIFQGNEPWLGILFWASYFTSILYYIYLLIAFFTWLFFPIYYTLDGLFEIKLNPMRLFAFTSIIIISICYLIILIL